MRTRSTVAVVLTFGLLFGASAFPVHAVGSIASPSAVASAAASGEIVVTFDPGATAAERDLVHRQLGAEEVTPLYSGSSTDGAVEVIGLPAGSSEAQAAAVAETSPGVDVAELNAWYQVRDAANDPYYLDGSLWGMYGSSTTPSSKYGSQASVAWNSGVTGSKDVYVAVIDEGTDVNHPDLAANIWTNPYEPIDGIDNDGNGYVDDTHGWDFASNNNTLFDPDPTNIYVDSHGTHVAGTIGGVGNNGTGVTGVNWNVTIIPVKFLAWEGGTAEDAARAVDYVVDLKTRHDMNIVAINASWGGPEHPQFLQDAIQRAGKAGIFFVNAVGEGTKGVDSDTVDDYPAKYDCAIKYKGKDFDCIVAVTAMTENGSRANWANWGPTSVDLAAPGTGILSTVPYVSGKKTSGLGAGYASWSGTSMAAPHVTGAIALYYSAHPNASPQQALNALFSSTIPTKDFSGATVTGGRLDIGSMLQH